MRRHLLLLVAGLLTLAGIGLAPAANAAAAPTGAARRTVSAPAPWTPAGTLSAFHSAHTATLLPNGKVLVAGGLSGDPESDATDVAELYNPRTGTWALTGRMNQPRMSHTATLLPNGKVLVAGGSTEAEFNDPIATAELYDPATGRWTRTGSMTVARNYHRATLLPNGKVLAEGGRNESSAELYNPRTGTWTATGSMSTNRYNPTATLLPNGRVLVAGGGDVWLDSLGSSWQDSAEIYNPATGRWSATGAMKDARVGAVATILLNGKVLVSAGANDNGFLAGAELFDYRTGRWTRTGAMTGARFRNTLSLLPNGKVLAAGGFVATPDGEVGPSASAELYDPRTGRWSATASMSSTRVDQAATLLPNGKLLVTAGFADNPGSAELYSPRSGLLLKGGGQTPGPSADPKPALTPRALTSGTGALTPSKISCPARSCSPWASSLS